MDSRAEEIAEFHTSAAALASELSMRETMAKAGFSNDEIDKMLLLGHLQRHFLRRWMASVVLALLALWMLKLIPFTAVTITTALGVLFAAFIAARVAAHKTASAQRWVRVKGGWTREA